MLFLATTILYIDRQILSLLKGMLDQELYWTDTQFGLVMAAFQATYGLGLLGFGWFVDRVGVKIGYGVTMGSSSAWALFHALAGSMGGFAVARAGLGLSESGNFPSAIKAVGAMVSTKGARPGDSDLQCRGVRRPGDGAGDHPVSSPSSGVGGLTFLSWARLALCGRARGGFSTTGRNTKNDSLRGNWLTSRAMPRTWEAWRKRRGECC